MRKSKDQEQKDRERFVENVKIEMLRSGINKQGLAQRINVSYQTMLSRFKHPEEFSFGEMQAIARQLNVSLISLLETRM